VRHRYPPRELPKIWLISDERIDARLEAALDRLPRGSGFIFRHYHLADADRLARFRTLAAHAARRAHLVVISTSVAQAQRWGALGAYGAPRRLARGPAAIRLVTAHSLKEIGTANLLRADAVLLSPVFATDTHPGARALGSLRFRLLAARARVPVIALGGMTARRAQRIGAQRWAAIASLAQPRRQTFPIHS